MKYGEKEDGRLMGSAVLLLGCGDAFLFYIPVAVFASLVPMLGMLMLPKTICYMFMIWAFWKQSLT